MLGYVSLLTGGYKAFIRGPNNFVTPVFPHESTFKERDPLDWEDDKFPKMSERDVGIPRGLRDSYWKIVVDVGIF